MATWLHYKPSKDRDDDKVILDRINGRHGVELGQLGYDKGASFPTADSFTQVFRRPLRPPTGLNEFAEC
jgi:hypothetical protein